MRKAAATDRWRYLKRRGESQPRIVDRPHVSESRIAPAPGQKSSSQRPRRVVGGRLGNGIVVSVAGVDIRPGQSDTLFLPGRGSGLLYKYNGTAPSTPQLFAGVEHGGSAYTFSATAAGLKKGSTIALSVLKQSGQVLLDASDTRGSAGDRGLYRLVINKLDSTGTNSTWGDDRLRLSGSKDEGAYFNWKQQAVRPGKSLNIKVGPEDGPFVTRKARYLPSGG